jgi:hypothetical protein
MTTFRRAENLISIAGVATAFGASVLTPIEDNWAAFPAGVRGTLTATDDTVYFVPFAITRPCTLKTIGIEVTTGQVSTAARLGVYSLNEYGQPSGLLKETAAQPATTGTGVVSTALGLELRPGVYTAAVKIDGASVALRSVNGDSAVVPTGDAAADLDGASANGEAVFQSTSVTGALASTATLAAAKVLGFPLVFVEFDAVEA